MSSSRREFVALCAAIGAGAGQSANAYPLGLKPGIQLWTVKDALAADQAGTLRALGQIGYREVELYHFPDDASAFKQQCADADITIPGGHVFLQQLKERRVIDSALQLGLRYLIVTFPTLRSIPNRDISHMSVQELTPLYEDITLSDYRWNAEQFNHYGAILRREGLRLGYHTHAVDFKSFGGTVAINALIESTDPTLVMYQLDTGHAIHAGADPIGYLKAYPARFQLLHLKDLKAGYGLSTTLDTEEKDTNAELGSGVIDWTTLFDVAAEGRVTHYFVEHEGPMDHPPMEAAAHSLRYLAQL